MAETSQNERTFLIDRDDINDVTKEDMTTMMNEVISSTDGDHTEEETS